VAEVILALDLNDERSALALLDRLPALRWVKLGSVLFTGAGPRLVGECKRRGLAVFLDLKWHDIPNTVRGAVTQAAGLGANMVTVHALGGPTMIAAAKEAAGSDLLVVAVTMLTSHDAAEAERLLGRAADPALEVRRLAVMARTAGADGVVASPHEVAALRRELGPGATLVIPGIRLGDEPGDDQSRIATPREAAAAGADYLVIGRPILRAPDPAIAFERIVADLR